MAGEEALSPNLSLKEFFESTPPGMTSTVKARVYWADRHAGHVSLPNPTYIVQLPVIELFCASPICNGFRFWQSENEIRIQVKESSNDFITYHCKNCNANHKVIAVTLKLQDASGTCALTKFGEIPPFGPHTPSRLISLVGPDRENFLKGRRAENQGLGIGAFAYYRRVIEDQKDRIFDEIIRVAKMMDHSEGIVKELESAKKDIQFTKGISPIKPAIPPPLMIKNQNPLTLLHSALSEGLHEHSDGECLELAQSIRIVLTELAERLSEALKDEAELNKAVSHLMKPKQKKQTR